MVKLPWTWLWNVAAMVHSISASISQRRAQSICFILPHIWRRYQIARRYIACNSIPYTYRCKKIKPRMSSYGGPGWLSRCTRWSVVGIATRYGLDGPEINLWGARFSAPVETGPGAHPASYKMGTVSFPGVKWPKGCVEYQPSSSAEVKERVELYLYSPCVT
jgi:hypothetical protein